MNIRCSFCQMPYAISRNEILAGLQKMQAENLSHYDAHCPRCRRATPIAHQKMEMFYPNWQDALKALETTAVLVAASSPTPEPAPVAGAESRAGAVAGKKTAGKAAGKSASKKEAEKPSGKSGAPAKKPAAGKKSGSRK